MNIPYYEKIVNMYYQGEMDAELGIGNPVWDEIGNRGTDAGANMKTTSGWHNNGNGNDLFGFSLMPAGYCGYSFSMVGKFGFFWTSTWKLSSDYPIHRSANFSLSTASRSNNYGGGAGMSVRCVKNE